MNTNKQILDNAPDGATHIDNNGFYLRASTSGYKDLDEDNRDWNYDFANHCHTRSLADIKRIAELENALKWSRDSNTGYEPSVSVMHRYYDELLPKGGAS